jgi:hypothetical protein
VTKKSASFGLSTFCGATMPMTPQRRLIFAGTARRKETAMSEAKRIADKYISRGGAVHRQYDRKAQIDDLIVLGCFVGFQDPHEWSGGYRADDAWAAMCRLLDMDPVAFRKGILGEGVQQ